MKLNSAINSLKIKDLEVFRAVALGRSIREAARRLSTTPGEVSKSIRGLEKKLGMSLFKRSATGVLLSESGNQVSVLIEEILEVGKKIESLSQKTKKNSTNLMSIASTSFLITHLVAPQMTSLSNSQQNIQYRFLDISPDILISAGLRGAFEIAFHFGELEWPRTWLSKEIGEISWVLCAKYQHPLALKPKLEDVLEFPFVTPTYFTTEGLHYGNDNFPVALSHRKKGHETSTADAAIPILLNSNHVAFLPEVLVEKFVKEKKIKILRPKEIPSVSKKLFLSIRTDLVPVSLYEHLLKNFQ